MKLLTRHEISGPPEYHIQRFPSFLYVVPFIFITVFVCIFNVHQTKTVLKMKGTTYREEGNL